MWFVQNSLHSVQNAKKRDSLYHFGGFLFGTLEADTLSLKIRHSWNRWGEKHQRRNDLSQNRTCVIQNHTAPSPKPRIPQTLPGRCSKDITPIPANQETTTPERQVTRKQEPNQRSPNAHRAIRRAEEAHSASLFLSLSAAWRVLRQWREIWDRGLTGTYLSWRIYIVDDSESASVSSRRMFLFLCPRVE